jgi:hypothetical protein
MTTEHKCNIDLIKLARKLGYSVIVEQLSYAPECNITMDDVFDSHQYLDEKNREGHLIIGACKNNTSYQLTFTKPFEELDDYNSVNIETFECSQCSNAIIRRSRDPSKRFWDVYHKYHEIHKLKLDE